MYARSVLDNPKDVEAIFPLIASSRRKTAAGLQLVSRIGEVMCGRCGGARVCDAAVFHYQPDQLVLAELTCLQCEGSFLLAWYKLDDRTGRAILAPRFADTATSPLVPKAVAYYFEQARLVRSVGANSAAVVMFRGAIEQVLADKKCTTRTCGGKLVELESDLKKGDPKADWAKGLDTELLRQMKIIGDGGTHGDAAVIAAYDTEMVDHAETVVRALLHFVYEAPGKKASFDASIRAKADLVKK